MRKPWTLVLPLALLPCAALALGTPVVGSASAEGETPASAGRWMLGLEHGPLRVVSWSDGAGRSTAYHYMTLTVTNKTAYPREWRPNVRAVTQATAHDPTLTAHAMPLVEALDAIRRQERAPGLVTVNETAGTIQPGKAIQCVAIFGRLDPAFHKVNVQIRGLASSVAVYKVEKFPGDRTIIVDAAYYDRNQKLMESLRREIREAGPDARMPAPDVEFQEFLEDRYWDVEYSRAGDEYRAEDSALRFTAEGWKIAAEPRMLRVIGKQ